MANPIRMADVGEKPETSRRAVAEAQLIASPEVIDAIRRGALPKGDPLAAAEIAGIQAAKRTADWIPLCHPLRITHAAVRCRLEGDRVVFTAEVAAREATGVEMEALTAAAAAALTVYDMTKSLHRGSEITGLRLLEKSGGRSGTWKRGEAAP